MSTLRVLWRSGVIADYEAQTAGARRWIALSLDPAYGKNGGLKPRTEPQEIPDRAEYRKAVQEKHLWPADAETAKKCNVPFDPKCGGMYKLADGPTETPSSAPAAKTDAPPADAEPTETPEASHDASLTEDKEPSHPAT